MCADGLSQTDLVNAAGLNVFLGPQSNMEMTAGKMDGVCREALSDAWWAGQRRSAEKL